VPTGARDSTEVFTQLMNEVAIQFGPGGRLIGILTIAGRHGDTTKPIVFVFLNAGLLHRPGPYRLHVRLARDLAEYGFSSMRVDLGGLGDSLAEPDMELQQSVAKDFDEIVQLVESELGPVEIVLFGLCSGADNAIRLALEHPGVTGLVLLDPVCEKDEGFAARARSWRKKVLLRKALEPARYVPWLKRKLSAWTSRRRADEDSMDRLAVRILPSAEQTNDAFSAMHERNGYVLSIFTAYATDYYNEEGQLGRVLDVSEYSSFCEELFWPHVLHTYPFEPDRRKLIEEIRGWAGRLEQRRLSAASES